MFYKTQIKSVTSYGAIDVNGRPLRFIGYLPVKQGDSVFTDGKFIFGNAPPKGTPATFDEQSGIPVLGVSDSSGENELRGYFTTNGKYKKYGVKGDEWLVNSDKTYVRNNGEGNIIDAEIAFDEDGNETGIYTVEKKVIESSEVDEYNDFIYQYSVYGRTMLSLSAESFAVNSGLDSYKELEALKPTISLSDAEYFKFDDEILKDRDLIIKKDGEEIITLSLEQLCADVEADTQSYVNFIKIGELIPEDHIKSRAILQNFKILSNGEWEALILCEVWVERGFTYQSDTKKKRIRYTGDLVSTNTQVSGNTYFHEERLTITITQYPEPIAATLYASTMSHCLCLFKINSYYEMEYLFKYSLSFPLYLRQLVVQLTSTYTKTEDLLGTSPYKCPYISIRDSSDILMWEGNISHSASGAWFVPDIDENGGLYYRSSYTYFYSRVLGNSWDRHSEYTYFENVRNSLLIIIYDSRYLHDAPDYDNEVLEIADELTFPIQDEYQAKIVNLDDDPDKWQLEGVYSGNDKKIVGEFLSNEENAHKWNMSCVSLKGGSYLFGIHADSERNIDGSLYKIDSEENSEQVAYGLKNFRLRELKKISKAKK